MRASLKDIDYTIEALQKVLGRCSTRCRPSTFCKILTTASHYKFEAGTEHEGLRGLAEDALN